MNLKIVDELKRHNIKVRIGEELKNYTTLRIGGKVDILILVENRNHLINTLKILNEYKQKYFVIGSGSNLLVSDNGFRGAVIKLTGDFLNIEKRTGNKMFIGAGTMLGMAIKHCVDNSLSGLENLFGIPGTIGGAVYMNAGIKNCTISDNLNYIEVINFYDKDYKPLILKKDEINFQYRTSNIDSCVILGAEFDFKVVKKEILEKKVTEILLSRSKTQPLGSFNAGCVFKNPQGCNMTAGMLIEQCGLKGFSIGDAMVSEKHANFIINKSNATAEDFLKVINYVTDKVYNKFNIKLELEIKLIV